MTPLKLRKHREAAKLSQAELAEATDTTQRTISRLESGTLLRPDLELLTRICRVLGITMAELMPIEPEKKPRKR